MPRTIAVIAAGAMGANVGRKFVEAGDSVLTSLEGRSDATRRRAKEAGMVDASWADIIQRADIVLSIIPPRDAVSFAQRVLREFRATERHGKDPLVFADCNAVNVETVQNIAGLFADTDIAFIDGCIIGGPPTNDYVPTFYGSANPDQAGALNVYENAVANSGIKVRILGGGEGSGVGNASALKMSYAVGVAFMTYVSSACIDRG